MLPTTTREQRYKRAAKLLEDIAEEPSTCSTPNSSEVHSSARSSERQSSGRSSEQHSSARSSEQHSSSLYSERSSSQRSSIETRSAASSSSRRDTARGHSRAHSKGKRPSSKAWLFQRAAEVLRTPSELHQTIPDPNRGKEKHSSALDSRIPQKSDEPESHIVSL